MNTLLLSNTLTDSNQAMVQGVTLLMVLVTLIIFIISWAINRLSILNIKKEAIKTQDLSTILRHALDVNGNYVIRLSLRENVGYNMHGDYLPENGMSYEESLQYIHPDDRQVYTNFLKELMGGAKTAECTYRWDITKEKHEEQWRIIHNKGIADYQHANMRTPTNIFCTLIDTTKEEEEELEEMQLTEKYRMMFEQSIAGIAFFDKDGKLITANRKLQEILKFQSEDDPFYYQTTIYDMPTFREVLNNRHIEELFFCTKSVIIERGVNCYTELRVHPIYDEDGALVYISLSIRDISKEREFYLKNKENEENIRRTNEAIQQYESELQYLMETCDMRFFRLSLKDQVCTFYKSMSHPETQLSIPDLVEYYIDSPFKAGLLDFENFFNVPRTDLTHMHPFFHEGEGLQWNIIDSVPAHDETGQLIGCYGLIRNVTPLIEKQEQLRQEKERADDSGRKKSVFMANMTHEIRTPLNAIVGFSDVLPMLQTPEEKKEIVHVIMNNCDMLLRLINGILAISDMDSGDIAIIASETDFSVAFKDISTSLAQRVQIPGVEFIADNPCKSLRVVIDKERIMQVYTNFVTNAVKYTQQGHIKVGYEYRETDGGGLYIYCEDTGAGIPKEDQQKVFERFVKLNDYVQGTGLGLNISKAIVEKCGGKIGVNSEGTGKGSTFWAWIPCQRIETTSETEIVN